MGILLHFFAALPSAPWSLLSSQMWCGVVGWGGVGWGGLGWGGVGCGLAWCGVVSSVPCLFPCSIALPAHFVGAGLTRHPGRLQQHVVQKETQAIRCLSQAFGATEAHGYACPAARHSTICQPLDPTLCRGGGRWQPARLLWGFHCPVTISVMCLPTAFSVSSICPQCAFVMLSSCWQCALHVLGGAVGGAPQFLPLPHTLRAALLGRSGQTTPIPPNLISLKSVECADVLERLTMTLK